MAAWRRKALELFPELKRKLNDPEETVYLFFYDLVPIVREAHAANDEEALRRIYTFGEWCFEQKVTALWNPAALCFYGDLVERRDDWEGVIAWLSPDIIRRCWPLWKERLGEKRFEELRRTIERSGHKIRLD